MSTNTHKSWHIHKEVNREKTRCLQDEFNAAKDKSAKGLEDVLSGKDISTNELLAQIHKLGDPSPLDSAISNSINIPAPVVATTVNDELSRFDPLLYPIELDVSSEEPPLKKQYQSPIKKEGSFNTQDDKSTVSTAPNRTSGQRDYRMQGSLIKEFCRSLPHSCHEFRRGRKGGSTYSTPYNTYTTKHATVARKGSPNGEKS